MESTWWRFTFRLAYVSISNFPLFLFPLDFLASVSYCFTNVSLLFKTKFWVYKFLICLCRGELHFILCLALSRIGSTNSNWLNKLSLSLWYFSASQYTCCLTPSSCSNNLSNSFYSWKNTFFPGWIVSFISISILAIDLFLGLLDCLTVTCTYSTSMICFVLYLIACANALLDGSPSLGWEISCDTFFLSSLFSCCKYATIRWALFNWSCKFLILWSLSPSSTSSYALFD